MPTLTDRFMQAVTSGDLRIVMSGLDEDEALVHHELANGRTALIVAARKGHTDVLSCLIRYGSNVNHQDRALETALHCAAQRFGGREAVEILLGAGASVGMLSDTGASMAGICLPATFTALQGAAQYDGAGHNLAARRDQYEVVRLLLDAWTQQKKAETAGCSAREWNAAIREAEEIGYVRGRLDVLAAVGQKRTRERASRRDPVALIASPIHIAIDEMTAEYVQSLLDAPLDFLSAPDARRFTPLHRACLREDTAVLSLLLDRGADPDAKAVHGIRPLHIAASQNHPQAVRILLEAGRADADATDSAGRTALHIAAIGDAADAASTLLEAGARNDLQDKDGATAFDLAIDKFHSETARRMLSGNVLALTQAIERDDAETAEKLIRAYPQLLDQRDEHGRIPLAAAAVYGRLRTAGILLDLGAILNYPEFSEAYPLHLAARAGYPEVVDLFLRRGADPNARDDGGETALYAAFYDAVWPQEYSRAADVVRLLLVAGADPSIPSFHMDGNLLDYAEKGCEGKNTPAVELIREALEGATRENPLPTVPQDASAPNEIAEAVSLLDAILADIKSNRSNDLQQRFQTAVRDTESRRRYLELYSKKYPGRSEEALVEKILYDLERDNR